VFVFIEPSSGQFLKHSNGTVMSPSLQCWLLIYVVLNEYISLS
jgi:hypothetical protein